LDYPFMLDIDSAFLAGVKAGLDRGRVLNEREWNRFFREAGLTNPFTKQPIKSKGDFDEWKHMQEDAKKRQSSPPSNVPVHVQEEPFEDAIANPFWGFIYGLESWLDANNYRTNHKQLYSQALIAGALSAWAELVLEDSRERIEIVIQCVSKSMVWVEGIGEPFAAAIRAAIYQGADIAGSKLQYADKTQSFFLFADVISGILDHEKDIDLSAIVVQLLLQFSEGYVHDIKMQNLK